MSGPEPQPIELKIEPADEGPRLRFWQRFSRREVAFGVVAFVGLGWVVLWAIPNGRIASAKQRVAWCTSSDKMKRLEPEGCLVGDLTLARLSPLTRDRALYLRARGNYEAGRRALNNAILDETVSREERDEQAATLIVLGQLALELETTLPGPGTGVGVPELDLPGDLVALGALAAASDAAFLELAAGRPSISWQVPDAILVGGDYERLPELMAAQTDGDRTERGAWLCLSGEGEAGAALLREDQARTAKSGWAYVGAGRRLTLAVCSDEAVEINPVAHRAERAWLDARDAARDPSALAWTAESTRGNLGILARLIVRDEPGPMELLEGIGVDQWGYTPGYVLPNLSEYFVLNLGDPFGEHPGRNFPVYDPDTLLRAATLVRDQARAAEELEPFEPRMPEMEPLTPTGQLELIGAALAIEAGREYLRRAQLDQAREAFTLADGLLPTDDRVRLAWARVRAGDFEAVAAFAQGLRNAEQLDVPGQAWGEMVDLGLVEAEALAARGQLLQARVVLDELPDSMTSSQREQVDERLRVLSEISSVAASPSAPTFMLRDEELRDLARSIRGDARALVLDTRISDDRGLFLRDYLWRRAELARRLGDAEEAEAWRARGAAVLGLAKTEDDQLYLYQLRI